MPPPHPPLRCLFLPRLPTTTTNTTTTRTFSTTPSYLADPPKKKPTTGGGARSNTPAKAGKTLKLAKNKRALTSRPPGIGERREQRLKVVLGNGNALEVPGLGELNVDVLRAADGLGGSVGEVVKLGEEVTAAMKTLGAFAPRQGWHQFRSPPATLVRRQTAELAGLLHEEGAQRVIITGPRLSGKSVLLMQTAAAAWLSGNLVLLLPAAKDLVDGRAAFRPETISFTPRPTQQGPKGAETKTVYTQPQLTSALLSSFATANAGILKTLPLADPALAFAHLPTISRDNASTLHSFALLGVSDPELAPQVFAALVTEVLLPSRPPLFVGLDGLSHLMRPSAYLSAEAEPIHAHDIDLASVFVRMLAGRTKLPNGGLVAAALSESEGVEAGTLDWAVRLQLAKQGRAPKPTASSEDVSEGRKYRPQLPSWPPHLAKDERVASVIGGTRVVSLAEPLSRGESRALTEFFARSGVMRGSVGEEVVGGLRGVSAGVVGEMVRAGVSLRF